MLYLQKSCSGNLYCFTHSTQRIIVSIILCVLCVHRASETCGTVWKVPFSQHKLRILLCIKGLRGTGDACRSLLKVNQNKCQSGCRKSSAHPYSFSASSLDLKLLVPGTINRLIGMRFMIFRLNLSGLVTLIHGGRMKSVYSPKCSFCLCNPTRRLTQ